MRPFRRVMPPAYVDGVSEPRGLAQGLPSAREVSLGVHRPLYRNDPDFTVMLAVWGQFIDHDITNTALSQAADGSAISCCDLEAADAHPECFPVRLAAGDPYYHKYNVTCMEFVRSAPAPTCSLGQREQLNQVRGSGSWAQHAFRELESKWGLLCCRRRPSWTRPWCTGRLPS